MVQRLPWKNPEKRRQYNRKYNLEWYYANKDKIIKRQRMNRIRKKQYLIKLLGGKCIKCGYCKCLAALQFHHPDKNKESSVSKMISQGLKLETIIKEAQKCELMCSNCHAEEHFKSVE